MYYFFLMYYNEENANLTEFSIYLNIRKTTDQSKKNFFLGSFFISRYLRIPFLSNDVSSHEYATALLLS